MRQRSRAVLLVVIFFVSLFTSSISVFGAAPTAGAKCTKLGTKSISGGLTYTCIKSGTKLVWSKGVKVVSKAPSATASPTPSATASPTPSAGSSTNNAAANNSSPSNNSMSGNSSSNNNSSNSGIMKVANLGATCTTKDEKGSIPNGTAICSDVNGKLIWQKWMPEGESNNQNVSNNNSQNGNSQNNSQNGNSQNNSQNGNNNFVAVIAGTECTNKGESGSLAKGTAYCAMSGGKLVWVDPGSQPIPSDGIWIFGTTYRDQNTANWNTDLPPDGWTGEPAWFQNSWDIPTTVPLAPKCTSNTPLTHYMTDLDLLDSITPQGFMQPGVHAMPVAHMYYNTGASTEKDPNGVPYRTKTLNLYAPADMTLYSATKITNTMADGYKYVEWMMTWHFCGTYWMFNAHIGDVDPGIMKAIEAAPVKVCQKGGQLNTSSDDCVYSRFAYKVKAGTVIGKASGRAHGFDFGFTDASAPIPTRINPKAYAPRWAAGLCHINFYPAEMRAKLEAKLIGNNGCGQLVSDVEGTAQGEWLAIGENKFSTNEDYHVALAKHWSDKDLLAFSFGWNSEVPGISGGVFTFKPNAAGPNNKPFTDVKSGQIACYDNLQGTTRDGSPAPTIFIKMIGGDTEKLMIAKGSGACGAGPYTMPANSQTFARKVRQQQLAGSLLATLRHLRKSNLRFY